MHSCSLPFLWVTRVSWRQSNVFCFVMFIEWNIFFFFFLFLSLCDTSKPKENMYFRLLPSLTCQSGISNVTQEEAVMNLNQKFSKFTATFSESSFAVTSGDWRTQHHNWAAAWDHGLLPSFPLSLPAFLSQVIHHKASLHTQLWLGFISSTEVTW